MITDLKIANVATYLSEGQSFNSLKEVNFVYGANGVGKTTVSRFIANPSNKVFEQCEIKWKGGQNLRTYVYNEDFIEANFSECQDIRGIFTLGAESIELKDEIQRLTNKIEAKKHEINDLDAALSGIDGNGGKVADLAQANEEFDEYCWEKIKKRWEKFADAFEGGLNSKTKFAVMVKKHYPPSIESRMTEEELEQKATILFGENIAELTLLPQINFERLINILGDPLFGKSIVGSESVDIASLIRELNMADWVHQGKVLLEKTSKTCPFCQQKLPEGFEEKLRLYFDDTYTREMASLERLNHEWKVQWNQVHQELTSIQSMACNQLDAERFNEAFQALTREEVVIASRIEEKRKEPSRVVAFPDCSEIVKKIRNLIKEANDKIEAHNSLVHNRKEERPSFIKEVGIL